MEAASSTVASGGKAPKPFLRRGEGVEKRVFASRYRKTSTPTTASAANSNSGGGISGAWGASEVPVSQRRGGHQEPASTQAQPEAWSWDGKATELASETQLLSVEMPPDGHMESGPVSSRFLRNSLKAAWASRQAEEELELEEFRALETQIKADVVGGARTRPDQSNQALPASSTLVPSASVRSYAAIHQHRPPQPSSGAPRGNSRTNDQAGGGSNQSRGWASPQPAGRQHFHDAFADSDGDDDGGDDGGLDRERYEVHGGIDGAMPAAAAWVQPQQPQHQASPGRQAPTGGRGFDDADAWNDTNSFFGGGAGAGAGVRKGAAAAANGAGGKSLPRGSAFFGGHNRSPVAASPLDDPWAAPAVGEDTSGAEAEPDDCSGWSADQQQKSQPQLTNQRGAEEDRGPDQPFVRALFNKQQRLAPQSGGGGRTAGKGASAGGGKGKAAEPTGPSPAELERMQALEEQLSNAASERATLVKMRTELEKAANRLEQERQAWEKARAEEQAKWEAQRDAEEAKLRRDRRVLEKQSKALLKLPNKKERTAMEAAEAALEAERREGRAREARHKLTVERLRRQLVELQERNHELREEVRWHEAQQLERGWGGGGAGPAAASSGAGGKGGSKPRPIRAVAVQTEPLAFLPPLECLDTGAATALGQPDTASSHTAFNAFAERPQFGNPDGREVAAPPPPPPAGAARPKSSGTFASAGAGPGSGSRLRAMQTGPGRSAGSVGASQPTLPTTWRAERAAMRKSSGAVGQWQASAQGAAADDDVLEEDGEGQEAGPAYYGHRSSTQQQHQRGRGSGLGAQPGAPDPWQQVADQAYGVAEEYGMGVGADEEYKDELEADEGAGTVHSRDGGRGTSPSSRSYVQNDDVEVLTDEAAGPDGIDPESPSTLAWQQHQEFMARMGLAGQEGQDRMQPATGFGGHSNSQPATGGQRQQQQQQRWDRPIDPRATQHDDAAVKDAYQQPPRQERPPGGRPGTQPMRQSNVGPAASSAPAPSRRPTTAAGRSPAAANPRWNTGPQGACPDDVGAGPSFSGSPSRPTNGTGGLCRNGMAAGAGSRGAVSSAFFGPSGATAAPSGAAAGAAAGSRPFPDGRGAPASAGTLRSQAQGPGRPSSPLRDSMVNLDGVSQTLAALRMDRHVGAAAAAASTANRGGRVGGAGAGSTAMAGPGRGTSFAPVQAPGQAAHPSLQRGPARLPGSQAAAEAGGQGRGWPAEAWSDATGGHGRPIQARALSQNTWSQGHVLQTEGADGNWVGSADSFCFDPRHQQQQRQWHYEQEAQAHDQQQPSLQSAVGQAQHLQQAEGYGPGPGHNYGASQGRWPDGMMGAAAANAASVAQSVSAQQQQQRQHSQTAHSRPVDGREAVFGAGGEDAARGDAGAGGDVLLREVRHPDGKMERYYSSGTRLVLFANGTRKVAMPDGSSRVYFANGDIKWAVPAAAAAAAAARAAAASPESAPPPPPTDVGVIHYYYAEVATWHSTYGGEGGVEVFYFPSGQTEAHHPGHGKEILFPDGVLRVVTVDGEEIDVSWDQLSWAVQQPQPRVDDLGDEDL